MHSISPREAERRAEHSRQGVAARRLAPDDAAGYCGLSTSFLNKLRSVGGGPVFIKAGRRVVYFRRTIWTCGWPLADAPRRPILGRRSDSPCPST
jgi:hypothetical protein